MVKIKSYLVFLSKLHPHTSNPHSLLLDPNAPTSEEEAKPLTQQSKTNMQNQETKATQEKGWNSCGGWLARLTIPTYSWYFWGHAHQRIGSPINKIFILWPDYCLKNCHQSFSISFILPIWTQTLLHLPKLTPWQYFWCQRLLNWSLMKTVSCACYPEPVVIFNLKRASREEDNFGDLSGFEGSFEVVYCIVGLEAKGVLSKRKGVIDGVVSGDFLHTA